MNIIFLDAEISRSSNSKADRDDHARGPYPALISHPIPKMSPRFPQDMFLMKLYKERYQDLERSLSEKNHQINFCSFGDSDRSVRDGQ
jgi:hypothetical protein